MCSITREQRETIVRTYLKHDDFKILSYSYETAEGATLGFMSVVTCLKVKLLVKDVNEEEVRFFMKFIPENEYHQSIARNGGSFRKEAAFYGSPFSEMRSLLRHKSVPECYLKDCETVLVLEDLAAIGYKNCANTVYLDLEHIYAAIRTLADVHAASLVFEHKLGKTLDQVISNEVIRAWFSPLPGTPGYNDCITGAEIISKIMHKYFDGKYPDHIIEKAVNLYFTHPDYCGSRSLKYHNALSHQDLWCNNIMFKYGVDGSVENAVLVDFQIYGYSPPTLDLLTMIYCNLDRDTITKNMQELLQYYYECLSSNIEQNKFNPDDILSREEFISSMEETKSHAWAGAAIYMHVNSAPSDDLFPILNDEETYKVFREKDRSAILGMLEKRDFFRGRVLAILEGLLQCLDGTSPIVYSL